jgi:cell division protein FtsB
LAYDNTLDGAQRAQLLQRLEALTARNAEIDQEVEALNFEAGLLQAELEQARYF